MPKVYITPDELDYRARLLDKQYKEYCSKIGKIGKSMSYSSILLQRQLDFQNKLLKIKQIKSDKK